MKARTCNFILLALLVCLGVTAHAAENSPKKVSITLVADQGVVIRSGETAILLDGCDRSIYQDLLNGKPPFSMIQMVLISHPHADHFSPAVTRDFLQKHPEAQLLSTPEIIKQIQKGSSEYPQLKERLKVVRTEKGMIPSIGVAGIKVEVIESSHAVSPLFPERVMGYVFNFGDKKIVYLGESEMTPDVWQNRDLKSSHIDTVILPYWIYKEKTTQQVLNEHIDPIKIVVTLEEDNRADLQYAELSSRNPKVIFMDKIMQSIDVE